MDLLTAYVGEWGLNASETAVLMMRAEQWDFDLNESRKTK